jgi:hypothetical protein
MLKHCYWNNYNIPIKLLLLLRTKQCTHKGRHNLPYYFAIDSTVQYKLATSGRTNKKYDWSPSIVNFMRMLIGNLVQRCRIRSET